MTENRQFAYLGNVIRELRMHESRDIALCRSLGAAIHVAAIHARLGQDTLAQRVNVSASYMSLIISGKRSCPARLVLEICNVTGSAAPLQWMCTQAGAELYVDPVARKRAIATQMLHECDREAAA